MHSTTVKILVLISTFIFMSMATRAQDVKETMVDSIIYVPTTAVDSSLVGLDIMSIMPSKAKGDKADVNVSSSAAIAGALKSHIEANPERKISGYRVRIFFDNSQSARKDSEATLKKFMSGHPGIAAYRSYQNPYFKVTVGDFRTRSEALELFERIKGEFPAAFILKENINYPVVDKDNAYTVDTVRVKKRVWQDR